MRSDTWPEVALARLGRIVTGKTPSTKIAEYFGGSTPFVTPSDMDGRRIISSTGRYLTERGVESVRNALIPAGSVMVSCIGSDMGKAAIAGRDCITNQQINSIVVDPANCAEYVYYDLSSRKPEFQVLAAGGSAQPILNKGHFSQVTLPLPPLAEQKRIAEVLGPLDDKIELNRRMNRTLESIARAIFKSWFVDFDPVRKEMGEGGTELSPNLAALDPNHEGFAIENAPGCMLTTLGDVAVASNDLVSPKEIAPEVVDHYSIPAFDDGQVPSREAGVSIKSSKFAVPRGCVLVSRLNPRIHRVWLPQLAGERRGVCSTEFLVLRPKPPMTIEYLYALVSSDQFGDELASRVTGTSGSHQRVKRLDALSIPAVMPPASTVDAYSDIARPVLRQAGRLREESRLLAEFRDALLPGLLDGSLPIGPARTRAEN